jgi:hypothetical protein
LQNLSDQEFLTMARQYSMPYQFPPVCLLPPAADAGGRTSTFRDLANALKAWIVVHVNQGNAAPVTLSVLQGQDVLGTGSTSAGVMPIWLTAATATIDALAVQAPAASFTTSGALADKIVVFEITPEMCLNVAGGFHTVAIQTSASNAANITEAELFIIGSYQGSSEASSYV